jgi:hypothetical protein
VSLDESRPSIQFTAWSQVYGQKLRELPPSSLWIGWGVRMPSRWADLTVCTISALSLNPRIHSNGKGIQEPRRLLLGGDNFPSLGREPRDIAFRFCVSFCFRLSFGTFFSPRIPAFSPLCHRFFLSVPCIYFSLSQSCMARLLRGLCCGV